ncbi:MAG: glycoside hydrolase family 97 protein [Bacteroidales bacterium]|nr:glycoside hydrolase family 97 protein [Bacteroidales bacterium]
MKLTGNLVYLSSALALVACGGEQKNFNLTSPDGEIVVNINVDDSLTYSVSHKGQKILEPSRIALQFDGADNVGEGLTGAKATTSVINRTVEAPFYRQASINENANELRLALNDSTAVVFRAYDDGVAYRIETDFATPRTVTNEVAEFNFATSPEALLPMVNSYNTSFEKTYTPARLDTFATSGKDMMFLPVYVDYNEGGKVLICESDLASYPGMFLTADNGKLAGKYAPYPDSLYFHPTRVQEKVATAHDFIAKTEGSRTYPWRIIAIGDNDTDLPVNDLVYLLGEENRIGDTSWIKPGKVAWDWWNAWGLKNVDFKPGIDNRTYKAYIDFAADNGIEYIVLDEGWSEPAAGNVLETIPEIDLPELVAYGKEKGVDIWLWMVCNTLDANLEEACKKYADMGIKGFKLDFIDRDDQLAVERVYRVSEAAAKHHIMLDIHGMYKPTGLTRTFPHLVNFEGIFGLEQMKWSNPEMMTYDVTFPYIRMVQGPADYTPGGFRNRTKESFEINYYDPQTQGTRAHQVAMYVVCDAPFAMLSDNPSEYQADPACTSFIAAIPTVYDETIIPAGKVGEYIVSARRVGDTWWIGGMTDWTPRELALDLSFLNSDVNYKGSLLADGADAAENATSYTITEVTADSETPFNVNLAPGGGFVLKLTPEE